MAKPVHRLKRMIIMEERGGWGGNEVMKCKRGKKKIESGTRSIFAKELTRQTQLPK